MGNHNMGSRHRANAKRRLFDIQGGRCASCGGRMTAETATLEHIVPRCRRGSNALSNLLLVHRPCNDKRGVGPLPDRAMEVHRLIVETLRSEGFAIHPVTQKRAAA